MALAIKKLDAPQPFTRKILLFAGSGAGKTFFSGSAQNVPELKEALIVDLDGGTATLDGSDISTTRARTLADLEKVLWLFAQNSPEVASYKTLIIDGLSEAAKRELAEITELAAKGTETKSKPRDRDVAQIQDYGTRNNRLLRIIRMARDLPNTAVIFTAWAKFSFPKVPDASGKEVENRDAKPTQIAPDFSDSLLDALMGAADDVWFLQNDEKNGRRVLYTAKYDNVLAKTRNENFAKELGFEKDGKFLPILINPTLKTIVDAYKKATSTKKGQ